MKGGKTNHKKLQEKFQHGQYFSFQAKRISIKYKYGLKVSQIFNRIINFYQDNGNALRKDSIIKEMYQLNDFQKFRPLKRGSKYKAYNNFVPVHM